MKLPSSPGPGALLSPRTDATARLLLLLSRSTLTASQQSEAEQLAKSVDGWRDFVTRVGNKFVAPFVYRHLRKLSADVVPPEVLHQVRDLAFATTASSLRVTAALLSFHRLCIAATQARHVYIKGLALATQCGMQPGERLCRDIDVLVASADVRAVLDAASAAGYAIFVDFSLGERATSPADLSFLSRYAHVVTLLGRDGVPIELHRRLDKHATIFREEDLLASSEPIEIQGACIRTLSMSMHFSYLCYHHTRHFWSKLHWVADLAELSRQTRFDHKEATATARRLGIGPTVEAALEFSRLSGVPGEWEETLLQGTPAAQFLRACLINLDGDLELERDLRREMTSGDFVFSWQADDQRSRGFALSARLRVLGPTPRQHLRHRLPAALHWVYVVRNAIALVARSLTRIARPGGGITLTTRQPGRDHPR